MELIDLLCLFLNNYSWRWLEWDLPLFRECLSEAFAVYFLGNELCFWLNWIKEGLGFSFEWSDLVGNEFDLILFEFPSIFEEFIRFSFDFHSIFEEFIRFSSTFIRFPSILLWFSSFLFVFLRFSSIFFCNFCYNFFDFLRFSLDFCRI